MLDLFGLPVEINYDDKGTNRYRSLCGSITSLFSIAFTSFYFIINFRGMVMHYSTRI